MDRRLTNGFASRLTALVSRFTAAREGAVAMWFAVLALPLAVLTFALIDVNRASVDKRFLQDALDAATLAAARSGSSSDADLQRLGYAALIAHLNGNLDGSLTSATFRLVGTRVVGTASADVEPYISNLWTQGDMGVSVTSEVARGSNNLEVSIVLDITGSMAGTKISDLKTAAKDLIDLVVSTNQTPYYSKAALVPFSLGVNVGGYVTGTRGAATGPLTMTGAAWSTGVAKTITGVSRLNPARISSSSHGFANGDYVWIKDIVGTYQLNDRSYRVTGSQTGSFQLQGINATGYSSYAYGGTATKCVLSDCTIRVTTSSGTLTNGDEVYFSGVNGMTGLNGNVFTVANAASGNFSLQGTQGAGYGTYSSAGSVYCLSLGCQYYRFTDLDGNRQMFQISNCVSERTGTNAYTDVSPATAAVGRLYLANTSSCPSATISPLSSDKTALKAKIDTLTAGGATAGQIGAAWGWYLLSPNFGYLFPSESQPAAYTATETLKVMVFMTDGDFNTAYCNGVLSRDSQGSNSNRINCNATNGSPTTQAQSICTAAKAKGIIIYTVGFQVTSGSTADTFLRACATDADHVYMPSTGTLLKDAFKAIGADITKLRLAK